MSKVTLAQGQQEVIYTELLKHGEEKVRIRIKSDSTDYQSYAVAEVFDHQLMKWNLIADVHYSNMKTPHKLYYKPDNTGVDQKWFKEDRETLLQDVKFILQ